jgi:hypothetical protein
MVYWTSDTPCIVTNGVWRLGGRAQRHIMGVQATLESVVEAAFNDTIAQRTTSISMSPSVYPFSLLFLHRSVTEMLLHAANGF